MVVVRAVAVGSADFVLRLLCARRVLPRLVGSSVVSRGGRYLRGAGGLSFGLRIIACKALAPKLWQAVICPI